MVLLLSRKDLQSIVNMKDVMAAVKEGFRQYAAGTVKMPIRPVINVEQYGGVMLYMPAYIGGMDALAVKVLSIYQNNPISYKLPTIMGLILLSDPKTGAVLSVMDGGFLTAMRTGAASGVATEYLARKDAGVAGIFGCGVQGRTQLMAVNEARKLETVKAYDIVPENRQTFCNEMARKLGVKVIPAKGPEEVVRGSDIVITASTSKEPVFRGEWLEDGTHINGIGSHFGPGIRELDETTVKKSKVVVDSKEACLKEAGDIIDPISMGIISADHIHAELGEIIIGKKEGRESRQEITLFKSVGLALQDAAAAVKAYETAKKAGVGTIITV